MVWYEEENQYVRAPTPQAFDRLVQNLENNDSVIFQSIALPSSTRRSEPDEPEDSMSGDSGFMAADLSDMEGEEVEDIKKRIAEVTALNRMKDDMIRIKDEQIAELQRQINSIQGAPARAMTAQTRRSGPDSDLVAFYKSQYESTLFKFEKLKEALAAGERGSFRQK
jgi:hypothetical protein